MRTPVKRGANKHCVRDSVYRAYLLQPSIEPKVISNYLRPDFHQGLLWLILFLASYNQRMSEKALVGVVMGSKSDYETLLSAVEILRELEIPHEAKVVSAHRTPDWMFDYAATARARGLRAIIAGAGGAAHLPGMLAAKTLVPVLGVPVSATQLNGLDALLSIVQMPKGVPVGTLAIGKAGAANAALLAAEMLASTDEALYERLAAWRAARTDEVLAQELPS